MDLIFVYLVRAALFSINLLPLAIRLSILTATIRALFFLLPRLRDVALDNLQLAFPERDLDWGREIVKRSYSSMARVIVDFARLPALNRKWAMAHVDFPQHVQFEAAMRRRSGTGMLIATGHLGSFELLAHYAALIGYPMSFVVRNSKMPHFDKWWRSKREANGNHVISRRGAFREVVQRLEDQQNVGILFDQNVRQSHAVFVDWFGVPAATTKTVALAALRTRCMVGVASVSYTGDERYQISFEEFDFTNLYEDTKLTNEEKVLEITRTLSDCYQEMIKRSPHEWFWMHRRWRTRPERGW
jgi:KDO2-lipid IV(A) lauroyltransferase